MIEKFEVLQDDQGEDKQQSFKEVDKKDATHVHKCYHNEAGKYGQCRPCKREKI